MVVSFVAGYFLKQPEIKKVPIPGPVHFVPKVEYRDTGRVVRIPPGPIDSAAVVKAYYTHRPITFSDTVQEVALRFDGVLFQNELITPSVTLHNFREPVMSNPFNLWGEVQAGRNSFELGLSVDKGKNGIMYRYDIIQGVHKVGYRRLLFSK